MLIKSSFQQHRLCLYPPLLQPAVPSHLSTKQQNCLHQENLNRRRSLQGAISVDPTNPSNYINLARIQVWLGNYDEAILNTQNALLQNPNNPLAHAVQGWALGFKENYADAEIEIKKAIDLDPNNPLAHAYYAEILINQGNFDLYEKAATESKIAQDLDPTLMETHRIRVCFIQYSEPRTGG